MDPALMAQMQAMQRMGGEGGASNGICGIPWLKDTQGILGGGETPNLAMLFRQILCLNPEGRNKFDIGNPNGWLSKLMRSLGLSSKEMLDHIKQVFANHDLSGGGSHSGPASPGLDGLDHSHGSSGVSYGID